MDNHTFSTKQSHNSKRGATGINSSQRKKRSCHPFELTEKQAEAIRLNLRKPFYLINITNGQLEKIQKQCKAEYENRVNKQNQDDNRREDKKIQHTTKTGNTNHTTKAELKEEYKPRGEDYLKKQKKPTKKTWGKISESRAISGLQSQFQQLQQNENQRQTTIKHEEGVKKKDKDVKQKKQKEISLEKQITEKEIKIQNKSSGHSKGLKGKIEKDKNLKVEKKEQSIQDNYSYTIPYLSSGQQRHGLAQSYYKAHQQPNRLCAMFGLPHETTQQQQNTLLNEKQKNFCYNIVQKLKQHKFSQAFRNPVDPQSQGVPDYHYVVYSPMDLSNITKKIKDKYHHISEFHADINLIFMNSYKYNLRTNKYFAQTIQFEDYYRQLLDHAAKNPQLYAEKATNKVKGQKMDSNEGDYTGESNKKNRRKFPELFSHGNSKDLTKSQLFQRQSRHKLGKNKSMMDEHSNFSHSIQGLENYQDINQQMQNNSHPTQKTMKKQSSKNNKQVKLRKSDSLSFSVQDYQNSLQNHNFQNKKQFIEINNQNQDHLRPQQNGQLKEEMVNQDQKQIDQNIFVQPEIKKQANEIEEPQEAEGQKQIQEHNLDIQCVDSKIIKNEEYLNENQQLKLNLDMVDENQGYEKQQNPQEQEKLEIQEDQAQQKKDILEEKPQLAPNVPEQEVPLPNPYFNPLSINQQNNQIFTHSLEANPSKPKFQYFHQHMPQMHLMGYHHHHAKYEQELNLLKSKNNGKQKHRFPNIPQTMHPYNYHHPSYPYADFHQHQNWLNQYNPHNVNYAHIKQEDHHQNNESITVNNINLQPQHYYTNNMIQGGPYHGYLPQQSIYPSIDTIMQNTIVNNNSTQVSKPKQTSKAKATGKSFKKKGKIQDDQDQYKYNSDEDEEYVIEINRVGKKKNREKKIKEKKIVKQNSSGQQKSQKKRGRQPKKTQIADEKANNSVNGAINDQNDQSLFLQPLVPEYEQEFNQQIGQNIDYEDLFIEKNDSYDEVHEGINLDFQDDNLKFM